MKEMSQKGRRGDGRKRGGREKEGGGRGGEGEGEREWQKVVVG